MNILLRSATVLLCGFLIAGCSTLPSSKATHFTRYEVAVPTVDEDGHPRSVVKREAILRAAVADFDGILIDQHPVVGYDKTTEGDAKKDAYWRILIDVPGWNHDAKITNMKKQLVETFGPDVWIVRYPVERIVE